MQRFATRQFAMQRFAARAVGRQHRPESYAGRKLRSQEPVFAECRRLYVQIAWLASARSPSPAQGRSRRLAGRSDPGRPPPDKGRAAFGFPPAQEDTRSRACTWSKLAARSTGAPARSETGRAPPGGSISAGPWGLATRRDRPICGRPGPARPPLGNEGGRCVP
jgi:hypothetical protein